MDDSNSVFFLVLHICCWIGLGCTFKKKQSYAFVWFLCNFSASFFGILQGTFPQLIPSSPYWQETSNWYCGAIGMPLLVAEMYRKHQRGRKTLVGQVICMALLPILIARGMGLVRNHDPSAPIVATVFTVLGTILCLLKNDHVALAGCVSLIGGNALMAFGFELKLFLLGLTFSQIMFFRALSE